MPANEGDTGSTPGQGRSPGVGNGKIPWTEEASGLQFMGSQRVRHDRATERARTHRSQIQFGCVALGKLFYLTAPLFFSSLTWDAFNKCQGAFQDLSFCPRVQRATGKKRVWNKAGLGSNPIQPLASFETSDNWVLSDPQ